MSCPRIALAPGEPAGIGPDLCLRILREPRAFELVLVADRALLEERAQLLGLPFEAQPFDPYSAAQVGTVQLLQVDGGTPATPGQPNPATAGYVIETVKTAVATCLDGHSNALVTGPVHKSTINEAGVSFTGHTELLAELTGSDEVLMLLIAGTLRVALVTTHLPLRAVPDAITQKRIQDKLQVLVQGLRDQFGIRRPRILVSGLNPHAGESGHLGSEEKNVIEPAIETHELEADITGPWPADSLFVPARLSQADAVLVMYHDQGLAAFKRIGMGKGVNITLGLPFIRTSVDHGTALDLAGTGTGDTGSLLAALDMACTLSGPARD